MSLGYTFILRGPTVNKRWDLIPSPDTVTSVKNALTALIPLPGHKFYRQPNGEGIENITISGTFGYKPRLYNGELKTGNQLFLEFREEIWTEYQKIFERGNDHQKRNTFLEFHNWEEDEHKLCEIRSFTTPRGNNARVHFRLHPSLSAGES